MKCRILRRGAEYRLQKRLWGFLWWVDIYDDGSSVEDGDRWIMNLDTAREAKRALENSEVPNREPWVVVE